MAQNREGQRLLKMGLQYLGMAGRFLRLSNPAE
jgi:hypothetical protein